MIKYLIDVGQKDFGINANSGKDFVQKLVKHIEYLRSPLDRLADRIHHLEEQYARISSPYVRVEVFSDGTPMGGDGRNPLEDLQIRREELKYEIAVLTLKQISIESQIRDVQEAFVSVCNLINNKACRDILVYSVIDGLDQKTIASKMCYEVDSIKSLKWQGLRALTKLFAEQL